MHFLTIFSVAALAGFGSVANALPWHYPRIPVAQALAGKVSQCALDRAVIPTIDEPGYTGTKLSAPSKPHPIRVVLGRGTQNYTCASSTADVVPVQVGAVADLYDASCLAQNFPDILHGLPEILLNMNSGFARFITRQISYFDRTNIEVGQHIFPNPTTPVFNYNKVARTQDKFVGRRAELAVAPLSATSKPKGAVPWLKLDAIDGSVGFKYGAAYRVNTAGGVAPANCKGQKRQFEVPYAAEYWFYE